jgi:hypothetical protein
MREFRCRLVELFRKAQDANPEFAISTHFLRVGAPAIWAGVDETWSEAGVPVGPLSSSTIGFRGYRANPGSRSSE